MKIIWICISIMGLIIAGAVVEDKRAREQFEKDRANIISPPPINKGPLINTDRIMTRTIRGYNYIDGGWNYTDGEIRKLREIQSFKSNGDYIYTPGRHVPTQEEIIENYIEENIDEIMDEYGN